MTVVQIVVRVALVVVGVLALAYVGLLTLAMSADF